MSPSTRDQTYDRPSVLIDGTWESSASTAWIDVVDAFTEQAFGRVPSGTVADIDRAVRAAAAALPAWSARPREERIATLERIADGLERRRDDIALIVAREVGTTIDYSVAVQAGLPVQDVRAVIDASRTYPWEESVGPSLVVREPVGVAAAITPWNYPLHQVAAKLAPALAAGCTIVIKPSSLAPLSVFLLGDIVQEAGVPAGVVNIVSGPGATLGEALASHPMVDIVSLTGSVSAGSRVMALAAADIKRVALELGGKSATVVLDDSDIDAVVPQAVTGCFRNTGQNCSALSRLLVPAEHLSHVEELAAAAAATWTVGDPLDAATRLGPLVSADQRQTVTDYIKVGIAEGARLIAGGPQRPSDVDHGFFVAPTVFTSLDSSARIAQEEIFGPVLVIIPYEGEDDAVRIANDSVFGLSGAVWSGDPGRAERIARRMQTGRVAINGAALNPSAAFGGYKRSGIGREFGRFGLDEYLEIKTLQR